MSDPTGHQIRAALRAEADDATAGDDLLERIRSGAARPNRGRSPRLLVAAALVLIGGLAATVWRSDDPTTVDVTDDSTPATDAGAVEPPADGPFSPADMTPATSIACRDDRVTDVAIYLAPDATVADVASMEQRLGADELVDAHEYLDQRAAYADFVMVFADSEDLIDAVRPEDLPSVFLIRVADPTTAGDVAANHGREPGVYETFVHPCDDDGTRPTLVALVREDGWLVTVDLTTGEQRELYTAGDPRETFEEGGSSSIDSVDLASDGQWIYFSTCCEPAPGIVYRIPVEGGGPEQVCYGAYPRVSPDGRFVAVGAGEHLSMLSTEVRDRGLGTPLGQVELPAGISSLAWSPDGTQLAAVTGRFEDQAAGGPGVGEVVIVAWDGTTLAAADMGKPSTPGAFASFTPDGTRTISSGGPVDDDRSRSDDVSRQWILWVDQDGTVLEQAGHESGDRTPIEGLPKAIAADW